MEPVSFEWDIETDVVNNRITLIIKKSFAFDKEEIEFIVNTIADFELFKFDILRHLGWCSSSKLIESSVGHLEFSWLNQHKLFGKSDSIAKCTCQLCLDSLMN